MPAAQRHSASCPPQPTSQFRAPRRPLVPPREPASDSPCAQVLGAPWLPACVPTLSRHQQLACTMSAARGGVVGSRRPQRTTAGSYGKWGDYTGPFNTYEQQLTEEQVRVGGNQSRAAMQVEGSGAASPATLTPLGAFRVGLGPAGQAAHPVTRQTRAHHPRGGWRPASPGAAGPSTPLAKPCEGRAARGSTGCRKQSGCPPQNPSCPPAAAGGPCTPAAARVTSPSAPLLAPKPGPHLCHTQGPPRSVSAPPAAHHNPRSRAS